MKLICDWLIKTHLLSGINGLLLLLGALLTLLIVTAGVGVRRRADVNIDLVCGRGHFFLGLPVAHLTQKQCDLTEPYVIKSDMVVMSAFFFFLEASEKDKLKQNSINNNVTNEDFEEEKREKRRNNSKATT